GTVPVDADRGQHAVEELSATADEGLAEPVLVGARLLADQHQRRRRIAVGEDGARGGEAKRAALETGDRTLERGEIGCRCGQLARARRRLRLEPRCGGRGGGLPGCGGGRWDGSRKSGGKAIGRRVADRLVGAHLDIPAQQLGPGLRGGHGGEPTILRRGDSTLSRGAVLPVWAVLPV